MSRYIDADKLVLDVNYYNGEYHAYSKSQIDHAPTIKKRLKLPNGEWIPKGFNLEGDKEFECSLCGCIVWHRTTNFCPDCGAWMEDLKILPKN